MTSRPLILLVEDSPALIVTYVEFLRGGDWDIVTADTGGQALAEIAKRVPELILLDLGLPDMDGMDILRHVTEQGMPSAVVVVTAQGSIQVAIAAMRNGAYDFLVKPFSPERLQVTVRNALERGRLDEIVTTYREQIDRRRYHGFIGSSLAMQAIYRIIDAAAPSKAPVFITGESGTGKELCAEAIHRQGPRGDAPFVALNCAAIPRELIESEIFGHVKGAFTGATADREGAASRAKGGTLFLDEICEMDINLQSKLLRFIQTGSFQRVGSSRLEAADVRFIAATNRDPMDEVKAGRFREDLFYRLHVIPIHMPPLREREGDVVELAEALLQRIAREEQKGFASLAAATQAILSLYHWPGNVRQLENVIRNVVVLHDAAEVTPEMLPPLPGARDSRTAAPTTLGSHLEGAAAPPRGSEVLRPLWVQEREIIERAVALCDGNVPKAAACLEVSPSTIYRKRLAWDAAERQAG
jgi:DNA-binding NtrC family response regulator